MKPKYTPLHSSSEAIRRACLPTPSLQGNIFAGFDETLLQRAEALAAVDIVAQKSHPFKPDATYHTMTSMTSMTCTPTSSSAHLHHPSVLTSHHHPGHHQPAQGLEGDLLDHLTPGISLGGMSRLGRVFHGFAHRARRAYVGHQPHAAPPSLPVHEHAPARPGLARFPRGWRRRGAGPPRTGVFRRALQAETDQTGCDPGGRGRGPGQPEDPRGGLPEPEHHLQVRVPDTVSQQHGGPEADPGGLAGGGGAGAAGEDGQAGDLQRRRQEEETNVYRGPGEALPGGVLRRAAAALLGEDRGHRREAGPEKERGPGLVLQPEAKTETDEVLCHALKTHESRAAAVRARRKGTPVRVLLPGPHRCARARAGPTLPDGEKTRKSQIF
ncbi:hypothetical protein fugu_008692 [Takifugu bimaculatus]|uniref:Uncharacterized protein n=1 Tax=Takifugu bimaculatus TaxID=433685 RepID=A0A4Z2AWN0_9TELE|nr:hypothetical protein fugu_008692 [Takifugu bimaculatus]